MCVHVHIFTHTHVRAYAREKVNGQRCKLREGVRASRFDAWNELRVGYKVYYRYLAQESVYVRADVREMCGVRV